VGLPVGSSLFLGGGRRDAHDRILPRATVSAALLETGMLGRQNFNLRIAPHLRKCG
jgi:hypothetical protein